MTDPYTPIPAEDPSQEEDTQPFIYLDRLDWKMIDQAHRMAKELKITYYCKDVEEVFLNFDLYRKQS